MEAIYNTIPRLLSILRRINPEAYQQLVFPSCGFSAFPAHAQEDHADGWWDTEAPKLLKECILLAIADKIPKKPDTLAFKQASGQSWMRTATAKEGTA